MATFKMPSLGADMEDGKLVEWLVKPGDEVKRGDIVAVVETQKGAIEVEVFDDGVVEKLTAELGQTLPVGAPLAEIRGAGEAPAAEAAPEPATPGVTRERAPAAEPEPAPVAPPETAPPAERPAPAATAAPGAGEDIAASPAARARAAELGLALAQVHGSGPGGAVVLADVEAAAASRATSAAPAAAPASSDRGAFLAEMRKAIAAAMARSKREIPHYYVSHTIDLGAATDWLAEKNAGSPPEERILMGALMAKAVALAAQEVEPVNGHFIDDWFKPSKDVHLGLAVALRGGGLVAPAILDAANLSLDGLMAAMRDLTSRTRAGRLRSSEMNMATITFSSLGETGVEEMAGIIVPPQVALVTAGSPRPAALVRESEVVVRPAVTFTIAADHRVSDGRLGAKFLTVLDQKLQSPEAL